MRLVNGQMQSRETSGLIPLISKSLLVGTEKITAKGPDWEEAISSRFKALATSNTDKAAPTAREQYLQVVESIDIPDIQLQELAQERAATAKRYLLNEAALAPGRAVVGKANLEDEDNRYSISLRLR